ncbi:PREDICTED: uncharacterized protein LOC104798327 isoform X1 [Tarenaya hassleriana]|uniref:uncharacterized protein LOC104798327 isoform X1 n=1 Tax=Tarenaya hassleriana TaxID=28532 RepID=UPI00053C2D85|nr:PREDICTED: uncharacterized protein LOC104798327 isoform X1 [Tarenaya hassleriana]
MVHHLPQVSLTTDTSSPEQSRTSSRVSKMITRRWIRRLWRVSGGFLRSFGIRGLFTELQGNARFASGLQTYLLSRDHSNLKSEFQGTGGKITVNCIENQPDVAVALGKHVFLRVGGN